MTARDISGWIALANAGVEALKSAARISAEDDIRAPMVRAGHQMLTDAVNRIEERLSGYE